MLATIALTIYVLESQIPIPLPVPGLKLGLSNVVTVFALFALDWKYALSIVLVRIVLGNLFTGQMMALFYSLAGGLLSYACMALVKRWLKPTQIWVAGVLGGIAHNIGQMAMAVAVTQTTALLVYLPILLLFGMVTGLFTGMCGQMLLLRFHNRK